MAPVVNAASVETIPADIPLSGDCDLDWIIFRAGEKAGVDPRFIHAVIKQESRYDPKAVSPAGAQGLMQMMPATAQRFGLKDPFDAAANVEAGTKYLKWLLERFDGDVSLALAGYNAGEGAVDKYKGVPPYGETQNLRQEDRDQLRQDLPSDSAARRRQTGVSSHERNPGKPSGL